MKRAYLPIVLFAFAIFISACGGGGGGSSAIPHTGGNVQQTTGAVVHVVIPKSSTGSSSARRPNFIAPNTATITIGVYTVNGATPSPLPTPISITIATSSDCTSTSGSTTCTITVTVPVATSVVLLLSSYDANGNLLGQAQIGPINTTLATIPTQSVSVGGVPAKIFLSPAGLSAGDDGSTHTVTFGVYAEDADNNIIVQPGTYPNPIGLTITGDTNGALSLSTTSVASPGPTNGATAVTLTYNSATAITQATITAASGSITASIPFAPIVFTPTSAALLLSGSSQNITVSEAGYSGAFTISGASSSVANATCAPTTCTPSSAGGTVTITIAPSTTTGSETISILDANGGFANIPVTVTNTSGGGALVAPAYTIDKYPIPAPSGGPPQVYGITTGPDGQSLWMVDRGDQTVDVVASPSACNATSCNVAAVVVAGFSPPPLFGYNYDGVQSIIAASDGNLYVGDAGYSPTEDGGAVYQLLGCSATTSTCSAAASSQEFSEAGPMLLGTDGNLYVGSLYPNSYGGEIGYSAIVGCCSFNDVSLPSPLSSSPPNNTSYVSGLAVDASGATEWFTDGGSGDVGFMPIPCGNCTVTELPADTSQSQCQECEAHHRPLVIHATNVGKKIVHPYKQQRVRYLVVSGPPSLSTALNGIVSGPDGYLYVADPGNHTIDQIDPTVWDGSSSEGYTPCSSACTYAPIPLPQTSGVPMNLTVGADGNIWFTDATGYVGFVSLTACASSSGCKAFEYNVGGTPWGIAAGADGDIWFTFSSPDSSGNNIGKVVLQ
jgi:hypothetical protein